MSTHLHGGFFLTIVMFVACCRSVRSVDGFLSLRSTCSSRPVCLAQTKGQHCSSRNRRRLLFKSAIAIRWPARPPPPPTTRYTWWRPKSTTAPSGSTPSGKVKTVKIFEICDSEITHPLGSSDLLYQSYSHTNSCFRKIAFFRQTLYTWANSFSII